jgi:hypothetical protein
MAEGTGRSESLSIWFFVGSLTLLYGIVLLPYGAWEWLTHHEAPTVLNTLHPTFWWGLLLTLFGAFYTLCFQPRAADINKA